MRGERRALGRPQGPVDTVVQDRLRVERITAWSRLLTAITCLHGDGTSAWLQRFDLSDMVEESTLAWLAGMRAARLGSAGLAARSPHPAGAQWLPSTAEARLDVAAGEDMRLLYLAWLHGLGNNDLDDDAVEPALPACLADLPDSLTDLADFLRIDPGLITAASTRLPHPDPSPRAPCASPGSARCHRRTRTPLWCVSSATAISMPSLTCADSSAWPTRARSLASPAAPSPNCGPPWPR